MFEEILEREPGTINAQDEFREYEEWDSLSYLSVIAMIDEEYGFVIPRDEFSQLKTIYDLYDFIINHKGEKD